MDAASFLSALIEIAIGVAGFAGIVAAVRQRQLANWPIEQLLLLQILFTATAATIVFALLPSFLTEAGLSEGNVWKVSSGSLVCWFFGAAAFRLFQSKKYDVPMPIPRHILAWALVAIGLQIYNLLSAGQSWPFLFGVMLPLINGFSVFLILILNPVQENTAEKSTASEG